VFGAAGLDMMHRGVGGLQNRPESSALLHDVGGKAGASGEGLGELALGDVGGLHTPPHHLLRPCARG
jgi:hypothetical protein